MAKIWLPVAILLVGVLGWIYYSSRPEVMKENYLLEIHQEIGRMGIAPLIEAIFIDDRGLELFAGELADKAVRRRVENVRVFVAGEIGQRIRQDLADAAPRASEEAVYNYAILIQHGLNDLSASFPIMCNLGIRPDLYGRDLWRGMIEQLPPDRKGMMYQVMADVILSAREQPELMRGPVERARQYHQSAAHQAVLQLSFEKALAITRGLPQDPKDVCSELVFLHANVLHYPEAYRFDVIKYMMMKKLMTTPPTVKDPGRVPARDKKNLSTLPMAIPGKDVTLRERMEPRK